MAILLSYYDNEKTEVSTNPSGTTGIEGGTVKTGNSSLKTFATILLVIFLILAVSAFIYLFVFQQIQQSPILKVLSVMPLNKPVPLYTAILSIENLSKVETPSQYNITYDFNASGSASSSGISFGTSINGTYHIFSTNNITREELSINAPLILSKYFSKGNAIFVKNGTELYSCLQVLGSTLSSTGNYTCVKLYANSSSQISTEFNSLNANLSSYLQGMNFTMTQLHMSSYNGNSCVQMSGKAGGVPHALIDKLLATVPSSTTSNDIKLALNGAINMCISVVTYQPVYFDLTGAGSLAVNASNLSSYSQSSTTSGSYSASVSLNLTEISSGAPISTAQILSLPSTPITENTSGISNILGSGLLGTGGQSSISTLPTSCIAQPGFTCSVLSASNGYLTMNIGQASGEQFNNSIVYFLNTSNLNTFLYGGTNSTNSTLPLNNGPPGSVVVPNGGSSFVSGSSYQVIISAVPLSNFSPPSSISGQIWISYRIGSGPLEYQEVGTVTAQES